LKSSRDRSANRDAISLEGGIDYVDHTLRAGYHDSLQLVMPLLGKLVDAQQSSVAEKVEAKVRKRLAHMHEELESIASIKEANTFTMNQIDKTLDQVQLEECTFCASLLKLARANAQSVPLQQRALRALLNVVERGSESQRKAAICKDVCQDSAHFVLETMKMHGSSDVSVLIDGCSFFIFGQHFDCPFPSDKLDAKFVNGFAQCIMTALDAHPSNATLLEKALLSLLCLTEHSFAKKTLLVELGAIARFLQALDRHPADSQVQQLGAKLVGSLIVVSNVLRLA